MLKINLLPDEYREPAPSVAQQFHRSPLMWIVIVVFGAVVSAPMIVASVRNRELVQINGKIAALRPKRVALDKAQRLLERLRVQETAFVELSKEPNYWSKRLNTLSDVIPDGVWFTEFVLEQGKGLMIRGSAIGEGGAEMMRVGRLVQVLKADEDFSIVVKDIQIESIKRVKEKDIEVVRFTLACSLADPSSS